MKLILEAIKALFRGVNSRIQHLYSTLGKRIDTAQVDAKSAKDTAKEALETAVTARDIANLAEIPICHAFSDNGHTYTISIDKDKVRDGQMLVIIPSRYSSFDFATLIINGEEFQFARYLKFEPLFTTELPKSNFLEGNVPVLVCLSKNLYDKKLAFLVSHSPSVENLVGTCNSASGQKMKGVELVRELPIMDGAIAFIYFSNGNTSEKPFLSIGFGGLSISISGPINDRSGNPISADAIKAGFWHRFVYVNYSWVMLD